MWFKQVAQVSNYDVRNFVNDVIFWQLLKYLQNTVFDEVAVHIFPQLEWQSENRITDLEIDKTNFSVTYEQGRIFFSYQKILLYLGHSTSFSVTLNPLMQKVMLTYLAFLCLPILIEFFRK